MRLTLACYPPSNRDSPTLLAGIYSNLLPRNGKYANTAYFPYFPIQRFQFFSAFQISLAASTTKLSAPSPHRLAPKQLHQDLPR